MGLNELILVTHLSRCHPYMGSSLPAGCHTWSTPPQRRENYYYHLGQCMSGIAWKLNGLIQKSHSWLVAGQGWKQVACLQSPDMNHYSLLKKKWREGKEEVVGESERKHREKRKSQRGRGNNHVWPRLPPRSPAGEDRPRVHIRCSYSFSRYRPTMRQALC